MKCPSCEKEIDGNLKFCSHCGAKLPKPHYCIKCGNQLKDTQKFCVKCGAPNPHFLQPERVNEPKENVAGDSVTPTTDTIKPSRSYPVFDQSTAQPVVEGDTPAQQDSPQSPIGHHPIGQYQQLSSNQKQPLNTEPISVSEKGSIQPPTADTHEISTPEADKALCSSETGSMSSPKPAENTLQSIEENEEPNKTETKLDADGLPIYEENKKIGSSKSWIGILFILLVLGGGITVCGQIMNWWYIPFLSWAGGAASEMPEHALTAAEPPNASEPVTVAPAVPSPADSVDYGDPVAVKEVPVEVAASGNQYSVTLKGTVGGKYAVEMVLDGTRTSEGFYPTRGKYHYTANGGAWINLDIQTQSVLNDITNFTSKEYTDGNLTGTWSVRYDLSENTLTGAMTNYKDDTYVVSLNGPSTYSILKEGYNKISGDAVTSSKNYPFYIDFNYENGAIRNAVYHNPDYNTMYNLSNGRIVNGEFYFDGDHNGQDMTIRFSVTEPYTGTMTVGSNVRNIKMNL